MSSQSVKEYCFDLYNKLFEESFQSITIKDIEKKRIIAQKHAIGQASIQAMRTFPDVEPATIWASIYAAHVNRYTKIDDPTIISKIIRADNSWKKSSGHAFEEMIKVLGNLALIEHGIEFVLQKELGRLIANNELLNEVRDISWLKEQCKTSIFDLYLVKEVDSKYYVFGCVQSKTSVRERVTRDREPSINAMKAFFLSIAIVLNGSFLKLPKFINMVNGNSAEYDINGWHALYVLSNENIDKDRIKSIDIDMKRLVEDVVIGYNSWSSQRQWINNNWRPETAL